jgi:MFS family permease
MYANVIDRGAMFVTIGGRLSDLFGRRYFFIAGAVTLIVGSIVSATGQSITQMIAGGAIFGAGSGFLEMSFGAVQVGLIPFQRCSVD